MKQINFKQKFKSQIENGKKTQTIRYWKKCTLNINDNISLFFGFHTSRLQGKILNITEKLFHDII